MIRVVADLAAGDIGQALVQQTCQHADNFCLGLATQAEQNEIVLRQNRIDNLRDDGFFVAHHAGKQIVTSLQLAYEVPSQFVFHAAPGQPLFGEVAVLESAESNR